MPRTNLLSEQGIINDVYDPDTHSLRVDTDIVLSGVTLNVATAVGIKDISTGFNAKVKNDGTGDNGLVVAINALPQISGTVLANQGARGAGPWMISGTVVVSSPTLPTGAATSANQTTEIASLASIDTNTGGTVTALNTSNVNTAATVTGLTTINNHLTTGIKADQGVRGPDAWPVSGTVVINSSALPTGAATSANQATEIASLATIVTNTGNTATTLAAGITVNQGAKGGTPWPVSGIVLVSPAQTDIPVKATGVSTALNSACTVDTISTTILNANPNRKFAYISNDSFAEIYLTLGPVASLYSGIRINPYGGNYEIGMTNLYTGKITGISTTPVPCTFVEG